VVTHVAGHNAKAVMRRYRRWVSGQRGYLVSALESLLDEDATGAAGGAEDGQTHDSAS